MRPVQTMAAKADAMCAEGGARHLDVAPTGDELEALGRAFNGLLDRLNEALERQRRFTGDASHQLRTPLAGLLGQVEVSLRQARSADEYRRVLDSVRRQGQNLGQIVEMLLFLARADADALPAELGLVDLAVWLPEYGQRWLDHPRAGDLQLELPAVPCGVEIQPPLLGQLLENLFDNACKYSPPNTPVIVRLTAEATTIALVVEDRGDGIPPEDVPHIFEPFYRSAKARRQGRPGVGLGLSVAQRIARLFGAMLTVRSNPGDGSRFELTLPRVAVHPRFQRSLTTIGPPGRNSDKALSGGARLVRSLGFTSWRGVLPECESALQHEQKRGEQENHQHHQDARCGEEPTGCRRFGRFKRRQSAR